MCLHATELQMVAFQGEDVCDGFQSACMFINMPSVHTHKSCNWWAGEIWRSGAVYKRFESSRGLVFEALYLYLTVCHLYHCQFDDSRKQPVSDDCSKAPNPTQLSCWTVWMLASWMFSSGLKRVARLQLCFLLH